MKLKTCWKVTVGASIKMSASFDLHWGSKIYKPKRSKRPLVYVSELHSFKMLSIAMLLIVSFLSWWPCKRANPWCPVSINVLVDFCCSQDSSGQRLQVGAEASYAESGKMETNNGCYCFGPLCGMNSFVSSVVSTNDLALKSFIKKKVNNHIQNA